jgi:hypothetical protein
MIESENCSSKLSLSLDKLPKLLYERLWGDDGMVDILEVIRTRRSIRRYKPDPIPDEILDKRG